MIFEDQPPLPPSQAALKQKEEVSDFTGSLKRLMTNPGYILLLLSYGINVGVFYAISTLLNTVILSAYPEIVESVKNCSGAKCLRPSTAELCCDEEVSALMKRCWAEDPADRPDFNTLKATIRKLNKWTFTGLLFVVRIIVGLMNHISLPPLFKTIMSEYLDDMNVPQKVLTLI
uniref:PK_Tyr_Ser-Thr domain-containing protein n=1 Tax=Rhodnius prolixus TaxID=13249 RepID=T1HHX7_RHOPR